MGGGGRGTRRVQLCTTAVCCWEMANCTVSVWPSIAAMSKGVNPASCLASMSAPRSKSNAAVSACPFHAA